MIKYLRLPLTVDVALMQEEVKELLSREWALHYNSRDFEGNWEALPLRSVNGDINNILALDGNHYFADTPFMEQVPYIKTILESFQCDKMGIRLLNLKAGAVVYAHSDKDLYYEEGEARLHIPIFTDPLVEFYLDEERIIMQEGECWYLNLAMMHRLDNKSSMDRIHLVMDCKVNDWMNAQFNDPAVSCRKEVPDFPVKHSDPATQRNIIRELRLMNTPATHQMADEMEAALKA